MLFLKSVFFTLLLPGTVTVLLPYVIVGSSPAGGVTLDAPWGLSQYVGLILIVTGAAVLLWGVLVVFVVVILAYEEPVLRAQFGESYARYMRSVHRWIPGRPYQG